MTVSPSRCSWKNTLFRRGAGRLFDEPGNGIRMGDENDMTRAHLDGLRAHALRAKPLEKRLAAGPVITVPTITLEGDANGAPHPEAAAYRAKFSGRYAHRTIEGVGHNLPQEAPQAFADAVIEVAGYR